jgi:hypothetical protein
MHLKLIKDENSYFLTRWLGLSAYEKKKEIFSIKKDLSWKLMSIGDGPFQILEKINDNDYKVNLLNEKLMIMPIKWIY